MQGYEVKTLKHLLKPYAKICFFKSDDTPGIAINLSKDTQVKSPTVQHSLHL